MRKTNITKTQYFVKASDYDITAEIAVSFHDLDLRNRSMDRMDKKQAFVKWWARNKKQFRKYNTYCKIADLLKVHYSSIIHMERHRKPSHSYKKNTVDIIEFLKS